MVLGTVISSTIEIGFAVGLGLLVARKVGLRSPISEAIASGGDVRRPTSPRAILERFERVTEVRVKIEKPEPDGLNAAAEAVELTLARGAR